MKLTTYEDGHEVTRDYPQDSPLDFALLFLGFCALMALVAVFAV